MPHLITNRARQHDLFRDRPTAQHHFTWERANAILYNIGGMTFIVGSVFFLPKYTYFANDGAWIFIIGSLLYLLVTVHDLFESLHYVHSHKKMTLEHWLELCAAIVYVSGTILFLLGSVFFLSTVALMSAGAWCFISGSALFLTGACINVCQSVQGGSRMSLQLLNGTAVCFVVGSAIFLVGSVPYLWTITDKAYKQELFTYVAWEFIVGSMLFFVGGLFNYYRTSWNFSATRPCGS